jgi:NAD(P)-dependent dehydrogenase (short-subunit alcohol dehydrogenase family)
MTVLDSYRLDGRVAVVTGASHGIGAGVAVALAEAGADVALAARSEGDLERVAERVRATGHRAAVIPTDVADLVQIERLMAHTAEQLGEPDVLFTAAGVTLRKPIVDVTSADWNYVLDVNLRGVYFTAQAFARRLLARQAGYGKVVHVASMTSYRGFADVSLYGMTKAAIVNLAKTQAVEWAPHGIRVNAIAPGWIDTPMTATMAPSRRKWVEDHVPQGHYGVVTDLAGVAVYLASPASDYCTGQTFPVDGGFTAGNPWPPLDP